VVGPEADDVWTACGPVALKRHTALTRQATAEFPGTEYRHIWAACVHRSPAGRRSHMRLAPGWRGRAGVSIQHSAFPQTTASNCSSCGTAEMVVLPAGLLPDVNAGASQHLDTLLPRASPARDGGCSLRRLRCGDAPLSRPRKAIPSPVSKSCFQVPLQSRLGTCGLIDL
jgi:hypothetical protein